MDNKKNSVNKFNKIMLGGIGVEGGVLAYQYYNTYLAKSLTIGNTVPSWFTLLVLLVPVSPLIGKAISKIKKSKVASDDLVEIINSINGDNYD